MAKQKASEQNMIFKMPYPTKNPQRKAYTTGNKNIVMTIFKTSLARLYFFGRNTHVKADAPKIIPKIEDLISKKAFAIKKVSKSIINTFNNTEKIFNVDTKYLTTRGV